MCAASEAVRTAVFYKVELERPTAQDDQCNLPVC